ncbi:response regulator [Paenibacillus humicola]|uniref:response regulator n=1 Tax=Paenibacillus humicola TaxID=3110540 RepID=UPI00237C50A4|nr:response regulator [Paenibacillus humicola]
MNVLIVDDDHLVRKGIVSLMPWDDFGLRVVGEAENGLRALQFLETHPVDLIMTDIAMPNMSGIDLLREVQKRYPGIWLVMLTFYQDFEYVQEALRLGAIDYIAKVELEKDNMHDILGRIVRRMTEGQAGRGVSGEAAAAGSDVSGPVPAGAQRALLLVSTGPEEDYPGGLFAPAQRRSLCEIGRGVWLLPELPPVQEDELLSEWNKHAGMSSRWAAVRVSGICESNRNRVCKLLAEYMKHGFFYEYRPGRGVYSVDLGALEREAKPPTEHELYLLRERWLSPELAYDEAAFRRLTAELEAFRPACDKLESFFYEVFMQWKKYVSFDPAALLEGASLRSWADWAIVLEKARKAIRSAFLGHHYSEDMMTGMMRAVDYINRNIGLDLRLTEVAERVHISRSYFSECFKNITGKTFHEYMLDERIDAAKKLLCETNEPIYRIAERCGYPDEKYFSKVFRKKVGVLPSEIRRKRHGREAGRTRDASR